MMNNSGDEKIGDSSNDEVLDFGKMLSEAREAQNYSINDIFENIKVPEDVLNAIEASDMATLPAPTFTQGYIRSYAKFLEISEDDVLSLYYQALPGKNISELRSNSVTAANDTNQMPLKNLVTISLAIVMVAAFFYGGSQYFDKKADLVENDLASKEVSFTGNSLDSPGEEHIKIEQNARLTDDGELIVVQSESDTAVSLNLENANQEHSSPVTIEHESSGVTPDIDDSGIDKSESDVTESNRAGINATASDEYQVESVQDGRPIMSEQTETWETNEEGYSEEEFPDDASTEDSISFYAQDGSWLEVRDANNERLFYNMLPEGGSRTLTGQAPFNVFMGNATTSTVKINDIEVDYSARIRTNNTVRFKISSKDQEVIFHK